MRFTDSILDFGLVRYTENQSRLVELKNFSSVETSWRVCEDVSELINFSFLVSERSRYVTVIDWSSHHYIGSLNCMSLRK